VGAITTLSASPIHQVPYSSVVHFGVTAQPRGVAGGVSGRLLPGVQRQFSYDRRCNVQWRRSRSDTETFMSIRWLLAMALVAGAVGTGVAFSQSAQEAQAKATPTEKAISARQWSRMKRQWSKQTVKWTSCNKQADDQKLAGRKSRTFIASCMTS
jgi:hypothetical protein